MNTSKINRNSQIYKDAFYQVFKSIQLSGAYALYYDMDLSKEELLDFNKKMSAHNEEDLNHEINESVIEAKLITDHNFDCRKEACAFPYRAKIKMYGKKTNPKTIVSIRDAADSAIRLYLILAIYTLMKDYEYTIENVNLWVLKVKEFVKLYGDGLTDDHVFEYFMKECELEIEEA